MPLSPIAGRLTLVALASAGLVASIAAQEASKPHDPDAKQLEEASEAFGNSLPEVQATIANEIVARVNESKDAELGKLLALRDRAVKELKLVARRLPTAFDPKEYARGLVTRTPVDENSEDAAKARGLFKSAENSTAPFYAAHVMWDFGHDEAADYGTPVPPGGVLFNAERGYAPDADVLIAWITKRFDFDATTNPVAQYFDHLYADVGGKVYPDVTLYEAWASGQGLHMPDVDTIAYARLILHDVSYVSPIATEKANKLYQKISDGFLAWFQYRTWIEAAVNLYVNPNAPLRSVHEGLRRPLYYLFGRLDGDVDKVAKALAEAKTRQKFLDSTTAAMKSDPDVEKKIEKFVAARQAQQWTIVRTAHAVLRAHSMLPKE